MTLKKDKKMVKCSYCGKPLTGTARKLYCSDYCRVTHNRLKHERYKETINAN
jgi:ribosomal protein L34E